MDSFDLDIFFEENLTSLDCSKLAAQIENFISSSDNNTSTNESCDSLELVNTDDSNDIMPDLEIIFKDEIESSHQKYQELAKNFTTQDPKCRQMFRQNAKYRNSVIALQAACIQNPNMSRVQLCKSTSSSSSSSDGPMMMMMEERVKNTVAVRRSYVKMKIYAAIAESDATEANFENLRLKIRVATLAAYVNILLNFMSSKLNVWDLLQQKRKSVQTEF